MVFSSSATRSSAFFFAPKGRENGSVFGVAGEFRGPDEKTVFFGVVAVFK